MTTITIKNSQNVFDKNIFTDVYDLAKFLVKNNGETKLYKLEESEITEDLRNKANLCREKNSSEFINI
ncbi:MAG: hypothetical protein Q9M94_02155 [Candidatus Gracilibacteria bacterium]|nr:hypothetical protein [Candidatus Gracilibacteria bacterium]MDQ7023327.1 hypothetical protein [Candidatus Gracilibacteria bacterium]